MIELLSYLDAKKNYRSLIVLNYDEIEYPKFLKLNIPYRILYKSRNCKRIKAFCRFSKLCKDFKPDIICTWGRMQTFFSIPVSVFGKIPIVNCQITDAPPKRHVTFSMTLVNKINFLFSNAILANSKAGIEVYSPPEKKSRVIYNGIDLDRFVCLPNVDIVKRKYQINTKYAVVMVGSFSPNKDFELFFKIANHITCTRNDISFIGVGGPGDKNQFERIRAMSANNPRIIFPGRINDVEELVNACDLGVLFSPNGEGISNAILEYMALGKPVIATGSGGTREIVKHNKNGYLIANRSVKYISEIITQLIDDLSKRQSLGSTGQQLIFNSFTIDKMGRDFEATYKNVLRNKSCVA